MNAGAKGPRKFYERAHGGLYLLSFLGAVRRVDVSVNKCERQVSCCDMYQTSPADKSGFVHELTYLDLKGTLVEGR